MHRRLCYLFTALIIQLFCTLFCYADFINGDFESPYVVDTSNTYNTITGWTLTGYTFNGNVVAIPQSLNDINISLIPRPPSPEGPGTITGTPGGISDMVISLIPQSIFDYFLEGATPASNILLPLQGNQTPMLNLRSIHAPLSKSGDNDAPTPDWAAIGQQATSISQSIVVQISDIDPIDHKVHIRFKVAPVLEDPGHIPEEQPFFAVQLNNLTTGRTGSNPLFFGWNYSNQPGVPWITLTAAGTNPGSNIDYLSTNWQAFDIAPGNSFIHVGDTVELILLASGCSPSGHDGHMYLDQVHTHIPAGLWVSAAGPAASAPGQTITYTYTYTNNGTIPVSNVQVIPNMPLNSITSEPVVFSSITNPTVGTFPTCTGTAPPICNIGILQPGQTGTFQMTVLVPPSWGPIITPTTVNNGNYPISGTGVPPLLGPLLITDLTDPNEVSNLVVNVSGLPTTVSVATAYNGVFTCTNLSTSLATADALNGTCENTSLPTGLSVTGCTISPTSLPWVAPATIPANQTVTCTVTGTPTVVGQTAVTVTSNADNNTNTVTNQETTIITVTGNVEPGTVLIPATLNGIPVYNNSKICCSRPVLLGSLPVVGGGPTQYSVIGSTGKVNCQLRTSGLQTYLRMSGIGSCTLIGTKNGITSAPMTLVAN